MRHRYAALSIVASLFYASAAWANGAVTQSGPVTPGHIPVWQGNGTVQDGGTPTAPNANSLGLYDGSQCPLGVNSNTSPGAQSGQYSQFTLCQTGSRTTFKFYGINGAPTPGVYFDLGGILYPFPQAGSAPVAVEPSIAAFVAADLTGYQHVLLSAYGNGSILVGDGGQGAFTQVTACVDDAGGTCVHDSKGSAFARDNPIGDIRQYGVTVGSPYDCAPVIDGGIGATACVTSDTRLIIMQANMILAGQANLYLAGMQVKFSGVAGFTLATGMTLDLQGSPAVGRSSIINYPGTIYTGDHYVFSNGGGTIQNGTIAPAWYPITYPAGPSGISQLYAVRTTMQSNGDTGVVCDVSNCTFNNLTVAGYDTAVEVSGPAASITGMTIDGDVGIWIHDVGSNTRWSDINIGAIMSNGVGTNEYFSVAAVADNGSQVCRLTLRPSSVFTGDTHSNTTIDNIASTSPLQAGMPLSGTDIPGGATIINVVDANTITISANATGSHTGVSLTATYPVNNIQTGMTMWSSGYTQATGGVNAWGRWVGTVVSPGVIDLTGSYCNGASLGGPTITGQWVSGSKMITNVSSFVNLQQAMALASSGLGAGTHIEALWPAKNIILLDTPTTADSGGSVSITTSGGAYTYSSDCNVKGESNPCLILSAAGRYGCGSSAGCTAAGGLATGVMCGSANVDDKVAGVDIEQIFIYSYETGWQVNNCEHLQVNHFGYDATRKIKDNNAGFLLVAGDSKSVVFSDGQAGKSGFGVTINSPNEDDNEQGCVVFNDTHVGTYEIDQGCFFSTNQAGRSDYALIANAVRLTRWSGDLSGADYFYEGSAAQAVTDTSGGGATLNSGASWFGGHFAPGGAIPINLSAGSGATFSAASNDTTGTISVGTGSPTDISFTFASAWVKFPLCFAADASNPLNPISVSGTPTTSTVAFVAQAPLAVGDVVQYSCLGRSL